MIHLVKSKHRVSVSSFSNVVLAHKQANKPPLSLKISLFQISHSRREETVFRELVLEKSFDSARILFNSFQKRSVCVPKQLGTLCEMLKLIMMMIMLFILHVLHCHCWTHTNSLWICHDTTSAPYWSLVKQTLKRRDFLLLKTNKLEEAFVCLFIQQTYLLPISNNQFVRYSC